MKYLLMNKQTGEQTLCDKVTIDGFDYYVSDKQATEGLYGHIDFKGGEIKKIGKYFADDWKKVIATNNPNIDVPKVVDDEEIVNYSESLAKSLYNPEAHRNESIKSLLSVACQSGYNKSQETHPNSDEDMKSFGTHFYTRRLQGIEETIDQSFQLWKEQKPKIVYYEN